MECDYLNGWIKSGHICKNLTQNGEPQRYSWGTQKKKKLGMLIDITLLYVLILVWVTLTSTEDHTECDKANTSAQIIFQKYE